MYVGVDVGGTFTDIAINLGDGSELILYKLSSTPDSPEKAIVDGIKTVSAAYVLLCQFHPFAITA